jgi:hypothetical protein
MPHPQALGINEDSISDGQVGHSSVVIGPGLISHGAPISEVIKPQAAALVISILSLIMSI